MGCGCGLELFRGRWRLPDRPSKVACPDSNQGWRSVRAPAQARRGSVTVGFPPHRPSIRCLGVGLGLASSLGTGRPQYPESTCCQVDKANGSLALLIQLDLISDPVRRWTLVAAERDAGCCSGSL